MRRRMSAFGGKSRQDFPHRKMSANDPKPTLAVQRMLASRVTSSTSKTGHSDAVVPVHWAIIFSSNCST